MFLIKTSHDSLSDDLIDRKKVDTGPIFVSPMNCVKSRFQLSISRATPLMCTTSPWAQGPVCNVIANVAWLPEFVSSIGGQGVHPIKGELGVMERVRTQAKAALVCDTQGCQLHPKTGEIETRKRRRSRDVSTHKATRRVESGMTQRMEQGEKGEGGTQTREMDV